MKINLYHCSYLILSICLLCQSCGDNEYECPHNTPSLMFYGYDSTEVDSVVFMGYTEDNGFQNLEKSFSNRIREVYTYIYHDTIQLHFLRYPLSDSLDWEIKLLPVGHTFKFEDIIYEKRTCGCNGLLAFDCFNHEPSYFSQVYIDGKKYEWEGEYARYRINLLRK